MHYVNQFLRIALVSAVSIMVFILGAGYAPNLFVDKSDTINSPKRHGADVSYLDGSVFQVCDRSPNLNNAYGWAEGLRVSDSNGWKRGCGLRHSDHNLAWHKTCSGGDCSGKSRHMSGGLPIPGEDDHILTPAEDGEAPRGSR